MKCLRCKITETYNTIYCSNCHAAMKKERETDRIKTASISELALAMEGL